MNKRLYLFVILILIGAVFVSAIAEPNVGVGKQDAKQIQNLTKELPINSNGEIDFNSYQPFWTKADERVATINKYVGPASQMLFGVELSLSWIFVFSVILWILLVSIVVEPMQDIFNWNIWWGLISGMIIATISMHGFGNSFVLQINIIATQWYGVLIVIVSAIIIGAVYSIFMRDVGARIKSMKEDSEKTQTNEDRAIIHADAEVAEKDLRNKL